ncbi:hypothetical protein [uncultured Phycicoccus sp.]|uniref:hypothetical protein n=1 Tax=uncultured Phycicoccus sp. TaxID=661422 RepID=UPI0026235E32|nr:hypothetical protein [uncultured Phycicoccus sp.]
MRTTRAAVAALAVAAALSLTGCGALFGGASQAADGSDLPSVRDLYTTVRATALAAESGHVTGFVTDGEESTTFDLEGRADGSNQRAKVSRDAGGTLTMLTVKGKHYVSGDWDFWAAATEPSTADRLVGTQVRVPEARATAFSDLTLGGLLADTFARETLSVVETFGSSVSVRHANDRDYWVLSWADTEVWVEPGTHRLLKVVRSTEEDPAELTFDAWDDAATFKAPSSSKVLKG